MQGILTGCTSHWYGKYSPLNWLTCRWWTQPSPSKANHFLPCSPSSWCIALSRMPALQAIPFYLLGEDPGAWKFWQQNLRAAFPHCQTPEPITFCTQPLSRRAAIYSCSQLSSEIFVCTTSDWVTILNYSAVSYCLAFNVVFIITVRTFVGIRDFIAPWCTVYGNKLIWNLISLNHTGGQNSLLPSNLWVVLNTLSSASQRICWHISRKFHNCYTFAERWLEIWKAAHIFQGVVVQQETLL